MFSLLPLLPLTWSTSPALVPVSCSPAWNPLQEAGSRRWPPGLPQHGLYHLLLCNLALHRKLGWLQTDLYIPTAMETGVLQHLPEEWDKDEELEGCGNDEKLEEFGKEEKLEDPPGHSLNTLQVSSQHSHTVPQPSRDLQRSGRLRQAVEGRKGTRATCWTTIWLITWLRVTAEYVSSSAFIFLPLSDFSPEFVWNLV